MQVPSIPVPFSVSITALMLTCYMIICRLLYWCISSLHPSEYHVGDIKSCLRLIVVYF